MQTPQQNLPVRSSGGSDLMKPPASSSDLKAFFEKSKDSIAQVVPEHLSPDRVTKVALVACNKTPALMRCTKLSLIEALIDASQLGLEVSGATGGAYLVPYGQKATMIIGYRGMIDLARRSRQVKKIEAFAIYKNEPFRLFREGGELRVHHEPNLDGCDEKDFRGACSVAVLSDGTTQVEYMSKKDIDAIRKRSRASSNGPWVTDYIEMAKKTAIRRLFKMLPISIEIREAVEKSDREEYGSMFEEIQAQAQAAIDKVNSFVTKQQAALPMVEGTKVGKTAISPRKDAQPAPTEQQQANQVADQAPDDDAQKLPEDHGVEQESPPEDQPQQESPPDDETSRDASEHQQQSEPEFQDKPHDDGSQASPCATFQAFYEAAESFASDMKIDVGKFGRGLSMALLHCGCKGKPDKTTVEWREKHLAAMREGTFNWDTGKIG